MIRLCVNETTSTAPHSYDMCSGFKSFLVSCQQRMRLWYPTRRIGTLPCENLFLVYGFSAFAHTLIKWYSLIGENLKQHCNTFEYKCFLIIYLDMLLGIGIPCTYVTVTNSQHLIHVSTYFTTPITLSVGQQLRHSASSV